MTVDTHVDTALKRVRAEQDGVETKHSALDTFVERVAAIAPNPNPTQRVVAAGGTPFRANTSGGRGCEAVWTAFAETVHPHTVTDAGESEPLQETARQKLTASVAAALAPASDAGFSPQLKRAVLTAAKRRRAEAAVVYRALEREEASLSDASDSVADITAWLVSADERPLSDLGFDALRRRHEELATHR